MEYFEARGISTRKYDDYRAPHFLISRLDPQSKILDYGCGRGQLMDFLKNHGFSRVYGVDILDAEVNDLKQRGFKAKKINAPGEVADPEFKNFDFIILNHILEHIPKDQIISTLKVIRESLLGPSGKLFVMVPNAQSATGPYWAYEDFTHSTLFTSGSLGYVCKMAGFKNISFVDIDCTEGQSFFKKLARKLLLKLFHFRCKIWNLATASRYHHESPVIYSYELKALVEE